MGLFFELKRRSEGFVAGTTIEMKRKGNLDIYLPVRSGQSVEISGNPDKSSQGRMCVKLSGIKDDGSLFFNFNGAGKMQRIPRGLGDYSESEDMITIGDGATMPDKISFSISGRGYGLKLHKDKKGFFYSIQEINETTIVRDRGRRRAAQIGVGRSSYDGVPSASRPFARSSGVGAWNNEEAVERSNAWGRSLAGKK